MAEFNQTVRATFGYTTRAFDQAIGATFGYTTRAFDQAIRATFGYTTRAFDQAIRATFGYTTGAFDQAIRATFGDAFKRLGDFSSAGTRFGGQVLVGSWQSEGVGRKDRQGQGQQGAFHDSVLLSGAGKWVRSQCYAR